MQEEFRRTMRIVLVVLACLALAAAGGAPSDHHVSKPSGASITVGLM